MRAACPTMLQMEAVECGAASLGMILAYHGRYVPLEELRAECGVSRDGSKASNMVKAARRYGLVAKGYKKDPAGLAEFKPPYIVFWNFNHFLVVKGYGKGKVFLNDPAQGARSVTPEEFDQGFTGVVLVFEPGPEFQPGGRKPQPLRDVLGRLRESLPTMSYGLLAGGMLILPGLALPVFTQVFVDSVLVQGHQDWLRPLLIGMAIALVLTGALKTLELRFSKRLITKLSVSLTSGFMWHVLRLPIGFYAQRFAGEISSRVSLNDKVAGVLAGPMLRAILDAVMVLAYGGVMLAYDPLLAGVAVSLAFLNFLALRGITRLNSDDVQRLGMEYGKAAGVSIAGIQAIETLKASGLEGDFFQRWAGTYTKAVNTQQQIGRRSAVLGALPPLLNALSVMAVLVLGGIRIMDGALSIGMLIAFQSLLSSFNAPVGRLLDFGQTLQTLGADLARLDDVAANPVDPQTERPSLPRDDEPFHLQGRVELKGVTFGYSRLEAPLIADFNLVLEPGQRVAFVGASGSGKSTVAKLLAGLYEPWQGEIRFDDQPRAALPRQVLANALAMVDQDLFFFSGTVRENLTLWDATISDQAVVEAAKDAAVHDVIAAMEGGYDATLLEAGANLSGGQRQRLEIARALLRNPSVLILDEATSALDTTTERVIERNLRRRGCTCIIVAHRLSTVKDCDEIVVFEKGRIVQRGTHDALRSVPGTYAELAREEIAVGEG